MRYVIAVKQPVYGAQGAFLAYQLAQSLLGQGHEIRQIFFFQAGVSNGNAFAYPANDEFNLLKAWQTLAETHRLSLHLCVAASQRRGVVDTQTAFSSGQNNLAPGFEIAGLGEFSRACLEADRLITL